MKRKALSQLADWFRRPRRKPLLLRGARQVGKSTLVRLFCQAEGLELFEINLEKHRRLNTVFETLDLAKIRSALSTLLGRPLRDEKALLFLDEIQETPRAIAALRYFHEEWPALAVIGAGSLLEFVLEQHEFSMPVGRVELMHLGPMTFSDVLSARGLGELSTLPIEEITHEKLLDEWKSYLFVGGMPEAVSEWVEAGELSEDVRQGVRRVQRSILDTYRADFPKYARSPEEPRLEKVLDYVPHALGKKAKYTNISREDSSRELKKAVGRLVQAKVLLPVHHTQASGLPLGATADERVFKLFFLDVGLAAAAQGVTWEVIERFGTGAFLAQGQLVEQFVAQHLMQHAWDQGRHDLHYWIREGKSGNAEVDFVIEQRGRILPVEVKSGAEGGLRSLHLFCHRKHVGQALRLDLGLPSRHTVDVHLSSAPSERAVYELRSAPVYGVEAALRE